MVPTEPLFAALALCLALGLVLACRRFLPAPPIHGRCASIDGLRGYLALCVFLHHAAIWRQYLATGRWAVPPSRLYVHFGETSVALFFMITAFLFVRKINDGRGEVDWPHFFLGRLLRLLPAYALVMCLMLVVVAVETGWTLNRPWPSLAREVAQWASFTLAGGDSVNGYDGTRRITAGVVWTLAYEWHFYLALPLLALVLRRRMGAAWCLLAAASVAFGIAMQLAPSCLLGFAGGALAVPLAANAHVRRLAASAAGSAVVALCAAAAVILFPTAFAPEPILFLTVAFVLVAAGCSVFGILTAPVSRLLGEPTYSIYLLHGLVLYVAIEWVGGAGRVAAWSDSAYCVFVLGLVPVVLGLSFASYRWIELPALRLLPSVTRRWRLVSARFDGRFPT